jgi:glutamine synthetase
MLPKRSRDALDALDALTVLAEVLGGYFVTSVRNSTRNETHGFERYVTDWEIREFA